MKLKSFHWLCHHGIWAIIIHQILSDTPDWPKCVTWPNIPQLKLGNIRENCARGEKIWRIIKTIVPIWGENMLEYLSLDIICSSQRTNCALLGKECPRTNIRAYFRAKWRLLFINTILYKYGKQTHDFWGVFILGFVYFSIFWGRFLIKQLFHSHLLDRRYWL